MLRIILIVLAVFVLAGVFFMFNGLGYIKNMNVSEVDLSTVPDGTYSGSFRRGRWVYNVEVTVRDHKIHSISLGEGMGTMAGEINDKIIAEILAQQSPKIDAVSGATVTTKALAKAVENALESGSR